MIRAPIAGGALAISLAVSAGAAPPAAAGVATSILHIAMTDASFAGVNRDDAAAAMNTWAEQIALNRRIPLRAETRILSDAGAVADEVAAGRADLVSIAAAEFLTVRDRAALDPLFIGTRGNSPFDRYVLLARADGPVRGPGDLAGRDLLLQAGGTGVGPRTWLEVLLREAGVAGRPASSRESAKAAEVVLPVFFKRMAACVATERAFASMVELNPQVGQALRPIARSEPVALGLVCLRRGYTEYRTEAVEELGALGRNPRGQQILTLLRYDGVAPFREEMLDSVRELMRRAAPAEPGVPR